MIKLDQVIDIQTNRSTDYYIRVGNLYFGGNFIAMDKEFYLTADINKAYRIYAAHSSEDFIESIHNDLLRYYPYLHDKLTVLKVTTIVNYETIEIS